MSWLLFLLVLAPALTYSAAVKRIVGGQPATAGQFKYIVALTAINGRGDYYAFCGGTLLDSSTVLTAAHCLEFFGQNPVGFNVRAGSLLFAEGGVMSNVSSYVQHPQYNSSITDFDFGILKLESPIAESSSIEYGCLQEKDVDPAAGTPATVAGWGLDSDGGYTRPNLYWVEIPIVSRETCNEDFSKRGSTITENEFCAGVPEGGKGDCTGDSGGPLAIDGVVTGLVSYSFGCADPGFPTAYAKVAKAIPFINQYLD